MNDKTNDRGSGRTYRKVFAAVNRYLETNETQVYVVHHRVMGDIVMDMAKSIAGPMWKDDILTCPVYHRERFLSMGRGTVWIDHFVRESAPDKASVALLDRVDIEYKGISRLSIAAM